LKNNPTAISIESIHLYVSNPFNQVRHNIRITSQTDQFTSDYDAIEEHFKNRIYPEPVMNQAIAKAAGLIKTEAFQPATTVGLTLLFCVHL